MRGHVQYGLDQVLERLANYDRGDAWRLKSKNPLGNEKKSGNGVGKHGI
jgi:hypothetical protein